MYPEGLYLLNWHSLGHLLMADSWARSYTCILPPTLCMFAGRGGNDFSPRGLLARGVMISSRTGKCASAGRRRAQNPEGGPSDAAIVAIDTAPAMRTCPKECLFENTSLEYTAYVPQRSVHNEERLQGEPMKYTSFENTAYVPRHSVRHEEMP